MSDPFVAEIRITAFNFAPRGWAFCNGQLLPISQNTALFSLLGTYYGGDGKSTFALPDLQGNAPLGTGESTTGSQYYQGQASGTPAVTLLTSEIPNHTHTPMALSAPGNVKIPSPTVALTRSAGGFAYVDTMANPVTMAPEAVTQNGGSAPHNNMMPYLVLNFIIAMQGIFPPRG